MAFSCFSLNWASIAREISESGSSGDRTDGLQGVKWTRAGIHLRAGGDNLSKLCVVFAEWDPAAQDGSFLYFSVHCGPHKF